jgi:hypothetical protein
MTITCTFLPELEVEEGNFCSYMRNGVIEGSQGYYNDEEEGLGVYVIMGNVEKSSNGRRNRKQHVTMKILHREVHRYTDDN